MTNNMTNLPTEKSPLHTLTIVSVRDEKAKYFVAKKLSELKGTSLSVSNAILEYRLPFVVGDSFSNDRAALIQAQFESVGAVVKSEPPLIVSGASATSNESSQNYIDSAFNPYVNNPFRVLGLFANMTRMEVRNTQQRMRMRAKVGASRSSSDMLSFLFQTDINESAIRDAFNELENPTKRLSSKLFWFEKVTSSDDEALAYLLKSEANAAAQIWVNSKDIIAKHNLAVLLHCLEMGGVYGLIPSNTAYQQWSKLISDDAYWRHIQKIDEESGFDPAVSDTDIELIKEQAATLLLEPIIHQTEQSLLKKDYNHSKRLIELIMSSNLPQKDTDNALNILTEPFEYQIDSSCDNLLKTLKDDLDKNAKNIKAKQSTISSRYNYFETEVIKLYGVFKELFGAESEPVRRSRDSIAECLKAVSLMCNNECNNYRLAETILLEAKEIAYSPLIVGRIEEDLKVVLGNRKTENEKPINSPPGLSTINGIGTKLYGKADYNIETKTYLMTLYFVFFYIPLFPLARYRVKDAGPNSWYFLSKVPLRTFDKWHLGISGALLICFIIFVSTSENKTNHNNYNPQQTSNSGQDWKDVPSNNNSNDSSSTISSLKQEIENGRIEIEAKESRIKTLKANMDSERDQIEQLKNETNQMENDARLGLDVNEYTYKSRIQQHNDLVNSHNNELLQYNREYDEYEQQLAEINAKIKRLNQMVGTR